MPATAREHTIAVGLCSHTNVGKTSLARTLLGRDVGEVRDSPHVTEFVDGVVNYILKKSYNGAELTAIASACSSAWTRPAILSRGS